MSCSKYGINGRIRINNNSNYLTGYAANVDAAVGSATENQPCNTETGHLSSTMGNTTGIYDMSGGAWEYVAGYKDGDLGSSGFTLNEVNNIYKGYIDVYASDSQLTTYSNRILGDATGEIGPFYDENGSYRNNWHTEYSHFVEPTRSWFDRGGGFDFGDGVGQFYFGSNTGGVFAALSSRLVLLG